MTVHSLDVVREILAAEGARVEHHGSYLDVLYDQCRVNIEPRPPYCDRGRFIVKVDQVDPVQLTVDAHDCFPRYYFSPLACASEVLAWAMARKLTRRVDDGG